MKRRTPTADELRLWAEVAKSVAPLGERAVAPPEVAPSTPEVAPPAPEPSPSVVPAAFPIDPYADGATDAEPTAIKPAVLRSSATSKRSHSHTRKLPVKPRRSSQPLDPDGTLDPYL